MEDDKTDLQKIVYIINMDIAHMIRFVKKIITKQGGLINKVKHLAMTKMENRLINDPHNIRHIVSSILRYDQMGNIKQQLIEQQCDDIILEDLDLNFKDKTLDNMEKMCKHHAHYFVKSQRVEFKQYILDLCDNVESLKEILQDADEQIDSSDEIEIKTDINKLLSDDKQEYMKLKKIVKKENKQYALVNQEYDSEISDKSNSDDQGDYDSESD